MPEEREAGSPERDEIQELRDRLEETEETLRAIRQSLVDAFVVTREGGQEVVTLGHSEYPYRMMVESMNEGAVTLIPDGSIFYCNPRFAEMVGRTPEALLGTHFEDLIIPQQQNSFWTLFREAAPEGARMDFCLRGPQGGCMPVQLSIYSLWGRDLNGVSIIATDISGQVESERKIRALASELTMAEQEERHRISQVLHDDLQQRLFAINTQLSSLGEIPGSDGSERMQVGLRQVHERLSEAIEVTRNLSIDLSPAVLHGEGLPEALDWLGAQMKQRHGLEIKLQVAQAFPKLGSAMRVLVYQAIRELLFNTVKHSGATKATVALEQTESHLQLTVQDEGSGFDVEAVLKDPQRVHGLAVIRNRLSLMGCSFEVTCPAGGGTRAVMQIPLAAPAIR